ncbi:hypothetical protein CXB34_28200 [Pseudomonas amygdali pv. morsprunorum]|uniref:ParA family protein n=1 Tax=Pseudomonas amygdali TaxID=47877 RepID=UPI000CDAA3CA|nr:ParA family protein [Pseudomonas amygdali]POP75169.1 hypothetical protein CXB34_28200 [Pseudomonas amygdali pv. morsprunorum]
MRKTIFKAYANQKGGVGKSILSYNDAFFIAEQGFKVLYFDGDEQGNGSRSLGDYAAPNIVASDIFKSNKLSAIVPVDGQNLTVVMADDGLISAERSPMDDGEMVELVGRNMADISQHFDYVVIDTAGANSRIANSLIVCSDYVAIPCRIDPYCLDVAKKVLTRVAFVQQTWNQKLVNLGIVPNEFDANQPAQIDWLKQLMTHYRQHLFPGYVSKSVAYKEAAAEGVPVWKLEGEREGESTGRIKTSARTAGKEVKAVFGLMLEQMEKAKNG